MLDKGKSRVLSIASVPFQEERPKLQFLKRGQVSMQNQDHDVNDRGAFAGQKGKLQSLRLEFFCWRSWLNEMHTKMNSLYTNGKKEYLQVLVEVVQVFMKNGLTLVLRGDEESESLYNEVGSVITRGVFKPPFYEPDEKKRRGIIMLMEQWRDIAVEIIHLITRRGFKPPFYEPDEKKRRGIIMLIEQWRDTAVYIIHLFFATRSFSDIFVTTSVAGFRHVITQNNLRAIWGDPALSENEKVELTTTLLTPLFYYDSLLQSGDKRKSNAVEVLAQLFNFLDEQQTGLSQIVANRIDEWIRDYNGRVNSKK